MTMHRNHWLAVLRLLLALVVVGGVGAGCTVKSLDGAVFSCTSNEDCATGELCLEGICRTAESLADGGPVSGNCQENCSASRKMCCGTACVDLASDDLNCGTCGTRCTGGRTCVAGICSNETSCNNNVDDNRDGLIDCEDETSCPAQTPCAAGGRCCNGTCATEASDVLCSNGQDDDCNGKKDCDDDACLGRRCAAGSVCDSTHHCVAGCSIGGTFVASGTLNPDAPCQSCNPAENLKDWSPVAAGSTTEQCKGKRACNGTGECRRATGQPCGGNGDCASKTCAGGICL